MSNSTNEESIFDDEETEPLWKKIIEKIKPYITREDIVNMDLESFSALINRLHTIKEITEQEQNYAKKNRDLILIRMGLLHNIPDLSESDLELALKQIAVRLTTHYFQNSDVNSLEEAENKVLEMMRLGFASNVTVSLNPEEEIIKLREKLSIISRVTLDNAKDIVTLLTKTKDSLMNIGISGSVFYEIEKLCQMLKRQKEEDLPTKNDIIEASFEWQLKIQK
ncbi:MAG: hypothetical protein H7644_11925 [Candidatus Heimdallarchaeota archaeon]|nr:hypothetical protein [Candidatus Heimdallarchaeota archaeon]MCK5144469.1 hypothetical protein [Candidatus Heimdallarchaeota archaeon]